MAIPLIASVLSKTLETAKSASSLIDKLSGKSFGDLNGDLIKNDGLKDVKSLPPRYELSDAALHTRVEASAHSACKFFGLPDIVMQEGDAISVYRGSDIFPDKDVFEYNLHQFKQMGCTNFEDMTKIWSHECGHRLLRMEFQQPWAQELGADFFAGVRSEMLGLPTGNFEKFLSKTDASFSHPNGNLRIEAIKYGRQVVKDLLASGQTPTLENCKEAFANSKFAKMAPGQQRAGDVAAFVDSKSYHYSEAAKAKDNANYYKHEAEKAAQNGNYSKAKDYSRKAESYETKARDENKAAERSTKLVDDTERETDEPRQLKTKNSGLEGQKHPVTEVPFEKKVVTTESGKQVEGVFPKFESKFDAQLPKDLEMASDEEQFNESNRQLKEKYDSDPSFREQFNERQRENIESGFTPYGYTWHHNEETGKMQLVDYDTHQKTGHTGGRSIWGGGSDYR